MKTSLSVRIAESFSNKEESTMSFEEIVNLATSVGFEAICMRASQAGIDTPRAQLDERRTVLSTAGLPVSMVTGDFAVPRNDEHGPEGLRNITPYLDLAAFFDADLIRVCMMLDEDIPWAQHAADEARERGIRLAHQSHCSSLFETVEGSVRVLEAVDRPNFGLIYEPANWMMSRQDYIAAIDTVRPWIFNVYVQNHRLNENGTDRLKTWEQGPVGFDHIGLWNEGGVEYERVIDALHAIEYHGFVTVHQAFAGIMSPAKAARRSHEYLRTLDP